ncbi:flagellin [Haloterrigena sp. SYSU A121-1]|uniref:Flagellin n=1 Tax=Haloterrigena gelatinilytica TaxID=2741724 RepID=A0A8J8KD77_9EURY|nr:flagellin [Haloterrigena gelatinilytica]NUB89863.1 flagellin [Haloterrigena gelatinilytica]
MVRASVVQLLLFTAAISAATLFAGSIATEAGLYAQSVEDEGARDVATIDSEISLINHPEAGTTYNETADNVTIYAKNVGGGSLEADAADLLIDGEYVRSVETNVLERGDSLWREGAVLELTAPASLDPGIHRAVVDADGARDRLEFEHRIAYWTSPDGQNGTADDCTAENCTVSLSESGGELTLEMATELDQPNESVAYASSNETVATVDPENGTTDAAGTDSTTLYLHETGETTVTLDVGWDTDEILIRVEE